MKNKKKRKLAGLLLSVMLSVGLAGAEEQYVMPDIEGNVDLTISYTYDDEKVKLDGAEISIYKVADVDVRYGDVTYTMDEFYVGQLDKTIDFAEVDENTSKEMAEKLSTGDRKADAITVTDKEGNAVFNDIEAGIYLVSETAKSGTADKYEYFGNFLITVPEAVKTEGYKTAKKGYKDETEKTIYERTTFTGKWNYKVFAYPKTETSKIPAPPTPPPNVPKTGDVTHIGLWILTGAIAGVAGYVVSKKRNNK